MNTHVRAGSLHLPLPLPLFLLLLFLRLRLLLIPSQVAYWRRHLVWANEVDPLVVLPERETQKEAEHATLHELAPIAPPIARVSSPEFGHTGQGQGNGEIELQSLSTSTFTSTAQASASKSAPGVDDPRVDAASQWELKKRASLAMTMDDVQAVEINRCDAAMTV
jgi:hypothetical protein